MYLEVTSQHVEKEDLYFLECGSFIILLFLIENKLRTLNWSGRGFVQSLQRSVCSIRMVNWMPVFLSNDIT